MGEEYEEERTKMVVDQIMGRGLRDGRLLKAFMAVPRHLFVPAGMVEFAYYDEPLPIGCGQTISQPYIVALMTSLLNLAGDETVLEIGTGSGYQAAILAQLVRRVHTVEYYAPLAEQAERILGELEYPNIAVHVGDGSQGWPPGSPYAGIVITAAAPEAPPCVLNQLAEGGRLVVPVGSRQYQELQIWERKWDKFSFESVLPVSFVPLRGKFGWSEEQWPQIR